MLSLAQEKLSAPLGKSAMKCSLWLEGEGFYFIRSNVLFSFKTHVVFVVTATPAGFVSLVHNE